MHRPIAKWNQRGWSLMVLIGLLVLPQTAAHGEPPSADPSVKKGDSSQGAEGDDAFYRLPEGSADDVLKFTERLKATPPHGKNQAEKSADLKRRCDVMLQAAEKLLNGSLEGLELRHELAAILTVDEAYNVLASLGDKSALEKSTQFLRKHAVSERKEIASYAGFRLLNRDVQLFDPAKPKELKALVQSIVEFFNTYRDENLTLGLAFGVAQKMDHGAKAEDAAAAYQEFANLLKQCQSAEIVDFAEKMDGAANLFASLGKPVDFEGTTLQDQPLDWSAYKGKVVLVDYWASWCIPCVAEMRHIRKLHDKYHDQGFEVLGICLDEEPSAAKNFVEEHELPWAVLMESDPAKAGFKHPMAIRYGVMWIPRTFLIDQRGNLVSTMAQGAELDRQMRLLFGGEPKQKDRKPEKKQER